MFKDRSGNPLRRMSLPLVAITCFATSITLPMAHAVGTTGDFGKDLNLTTSLHHFQVDKEKYIGQRFEFNCPARTVRDQEAQIYGTDAYPANSPICIAALHAGAVTMDGGPVTVQLNPGLNGYQGSVSNDVESRDFDGTPLSIMFLTERTRDTVDELQREWAPRLQWDDKFSQTGLANIRLTGQRFVFHCPGAPQNLTGRRVYGTDSYPLNSYVCLSAVHAGQITQAGGPVLVQMDPALEGKFVGSMRNGLESKDGAKSPRSISFPGAAEHNSIAGAGRIPAVPTSESASGKQHPKALLKKATRSLFD